MAEKAKAKAKDKKALVPALAGAEQAAGVKDQKKSVRDLVRGKPGDGGGDDGGGLAVGAETDAAEKEADALADKALAEPEKDTQDKPDDGASAEPEKKPDKEKSRADLPANDNGPAPIAVAAAKARGPPTHEVPQAHHAPQTITMSTGPPALQRPAGISPSGDAGVIRRTAEMDSQPSTDSLSSVPAMAPNQSDVAVSNEEETTFEETSEEDWSTMADQGAIMMKRQARHGGGFTAPSEISRQIAKASGGQALPEPVRRDFEHRFGARFDHVRVHVDPQITRALGARAFVYRQHLWLKSGSDIGNRRLLAHELVHVLQQTPLRPLQHARGPPAQQPGMQYPARAPPARAPLPRTLRPATSSRAPPAHVRQPLRPRQMLRPRARRNSPRPRAHDPASLSPTFNSPSPQSGTGSLAAKATPMQPAVSRRAEHEPDDGFLERRAEDVADRLDSYQVLKVIIGRRLFTGTTVTRSATNFLGAFMRFVGAEETFEQMRQSGTLQDGFDYISGRFTYYDLTWDRVQRMFGQAYDEFEWTSPIASLTRIFRPFFSDVFDCAADVLGKIAELIAEAFVIGFGPMGRAVWEKIKAIGEVIGLIVADPIGFALNLVRACVRGVQQFGANIWSHIKRGLLAWLLGPLASMGITLPEKLDLMGIMNVILQVLGLTYPQLRPRIARALDPNGEIKVTVVERMIEFVGLIYNEGIGAAWRKLMEYAENLQQQAIESVKSWAITAIVTAGVRKLAAWSNPAGALIDILFTIYNLIVFFVERFQQILDFANSVFESIGNIARGQLNQAASYIENAMALTIPIIISFLTRLLGLPDVAGAVRRLVTAVRAKIHRAFDKLLQWIVKKVKKLFARLVSRFKRDRGPDTDSLNLQGTPHQMELVEEGNLRKLVIRSSPFHMTAAYLGEQCDKLEQVAEEPLTTELLPQLRQAKEELATLETKEARNAGQRTPNRNTPQQAQRREESLGRIKQLLENGTRKEVLSDQERDTGTEVNPDRVGAEDEVGNQEIPEHQKDQVKNDFNEPAFRFILQDDKVEGEGFAGPWNDAKAKREEIKARFEDPDDDKSAGGKYLIELDHNPEHQILWRLAHLEWLPPPPEREDDRATPSHTQPERRYPGLAAQYNADPPGDGRADPLGDGSYNRDSGPGAMAMATRREVNTSGINKQAPNVTALRDLAPFDAKRKRFVWDPTKPVPDFKQPVLSAAGEHKRLLVENYRRFHETRDTDDATMQAIQTNGQQIITATAQYFEGRTEPGWSMAGAEGGRLSAIGLREDPTEAELQYGTYNAAQAIKQGKRYGTSLETHHMIEQSVMRALKKETKETFDLGAIMRGDPSRLAEWQAPGETPYAVLDQLLAGKRIAPEGTADNAAAGGAAPGGAQGPGEPGQAAPQDQAEPPAQPINVGAEKRSIGSVSGISVDCGFATGKDIKGDGFSVNVMRQVNQLARSSPSEGPVAAVNRRRTDVFVLANQRAVQAVRDAYTFTEDTITSEQLVAARSAAKDNYRAAVEGKTDMDLKPGLESALDGAATTAHATFSRLQADSMAKITPADEGSPAYDDFADHEGALQKPREVLRRLRARHAEVDDVELFKRSNRATWLTR